VFSRSTRKRDSLLLFMVLAALAYLAYLLVKIKYVNKHRLLRSDGYIAFFLYAAMLGVLVSLEAFVD